MRRALVLGSALSALLLAACPSPPKDGECKTSKDCEGQAGFGKVCVQGRCQECAADADCKPGFVCTGNRCEPKPVPVAEPTPVKEPTPECAADGDCGPGRACQGGRCVTPAVDPACADARAFTVRFGFDEASLSGDATGTLQKLAACLRSAPPRRVQVDGHADDRGTTQYNLALGKKRAEAVRKYLADLGVGGGVETNTYGEEQPACREQTEACWAQNRRAEFTIER